MHSKSLFMILNLSLNMFLCTAHVFAQEKNSENTWKLSQGKKSPEAKIADLAWLAGHWQGDAMGGQFEETWNPPLSGSMMGMFKHIKANEVNFYEFLTIVEHDHSILLRLKHFDKSLRGWEAKDKSIEFPLVKLTKNEACFEGLTFRKVDKHTMHVFVVIGDGKGQSQELKFACKRSTEQNRSASK